MSRRTHIWTAPGVFSWIETLVIDAQARAAALAAATRYRATWRHAALVRLFAEHDAVGGAIPLVKRSKTPSRSTRQVAAALRRRK